MDDVDRDDGIFAIFEDALEVAFGGGWPGASVLLGIAATAAVTLLLQRTR